jgi:hypothetical protein
MHANDRVGLELGELKGRLEEDDGEKEDLGIVSCGGCGCVDATGDARSSQIRSGTGCGYRQSGRGLSIRSDRVGRLWVVVR